MAPVAVTHTRNPAAVPGFSTNLRTFAVNPSGLNNTAEGGTDGVTVSAANSGGASGDAWSGVTGGGNAGTFSVTHPAHGALGYSDSSVYWLLGSPVDDGYGRIYLYFTTSGQNMYIRGAQAAVTARWHLVVSDLQFRILDGSLVEQANASFAPGLNTMMRLEWHHLTPGQVSAQLWTTNPYSSGPPDKTLVAATSTDGQIDEYVFNYTSNTGIYFDEVNGFATTAIGPVSAPFAYTDSGTIPLTLGLSGADQVDSTDAGTIPLTLAVSGADQVASTDSGAIPFTLALSGADGYLTSGGGYIVDRHSNRVLSAP